MLIALMEGFIINSAIIRRNVKAKAPLRVQLSLTFEGEGGKSKKLRLYKVKKRGREGSIESQQKFDFFIMILRLTQTVKNEVMNIVCSVTDLQQTNCWQ